ncbi:hypothetical protein FZC30_22775 [Comamonas thiooxydans]|nr:hypothetical protein FZC30_22775 [Comamonas thiooxydans]
MFSLLGYKRQTEFWRDIWLMLLEPTSEIQPIPSSLEQDPSPTPPAKQLDPLAPAASDGPDEGACRDLTSYLSSQR